MCGLIFAARPEVWPEVVVANLARAGRNKGAFTYTEYVPGNTLTAVELLDTSRAVSGPDYAFKEAGITHLQAPTSAASRPHPAQAPKTLVWHNGLFQPAGMGIMQEMLRSKAEWDTELVALAVAQGFESMAFATLGVIPASFACIAFHDGNLYAFRNSIAPLYVDEKRGDTLSSVKTGDVSIELTAGVVYWFREGVWQQSSFGFEVSHNPYGI